MLCSIKKNETIYDATHAPINGNNALDCIVVSSAKMIEVSKARDAPANIAAIPTNAVKGIEISALGKNCKINKPINEPVAPPIVKSGASVPPEVPLPNAIDQETNFKRQSERITCMPILPDSKFVILS